MHAFRLDDEVKEKKFKTCLVIARECLAFLRYPSLHALVECQGTQLGSSYRLPESAEGFTHFTAKAQWNQFLQYLSRTYFIRFLMDGSIDLGNTKQELVLVDKDDAC